MGKTSIEWTRSDDGTAGMTWNPVMGCSRVSEGCRACYAERIAARFSGPGQPYEGLATMGKNGPRWTGKVRLIDSALYEPLRWRKPRRVFVNSMSDLFHEQLSDEDIDKVFAIIQASPQHQFQVLTKRPERMRIYVIGAKDRVRDACEYLADERGWFHAHQDRAWPLDNVWLGVSTENQETANERIPFLLRTPAAIRFVSCEPLLGHIALPIPRTWGRRSDGKWGCDACYNGDRCDERNHVSRNSCEACLGTGAVQSIDWCIVGSESGPSARPMDRAWARALKDQCVAAGVPFFLKQTLDERGRKVSLPLLDGRQWAEFPGGVQ